ncbi:MAG: FHA domain-containing protein [Gemmataceae bacterium]|nr:FHA domain-containing protein [Gemmataceae bacterium]
MKFNLVVLNTGKNLSKEIPIGNNEFRIGKDPACQLKPAAPGIADKHCSLVLRQGKAILKDFGSPEGTLLNEKKVQGEVELKNGDKIKVGPLLFGVKLEMPVEKPKETPKPAEAKTAPPDASSSSGEEDMDDLLFGDEEKSTETGSWRTGGGGSSGSEGKNQEQGGSGNGENKPAEAAKPLGNTSDAAADLLKKHARPKK